AFVILFFFSSRRRHTRSYGDWSSDVCSSDLFANSGATTLGFWFFQNPVGANPDGTFSGAHAVGDIFIVADFSSSVGTIIAYKWVDRKSTRLNSSHRTISYAVFCLKKKKYKQ